MKKNKGILIVDDEVFQREYIKSILKKEGFTNIFEADNGIECINLLNNCQDDIYMLVLDLVLPKKDGYQVIQYISQNHPVNVGLIIVSAYLSIEVVKLESQFETEISSILSKPIDVSSLIRAIDSGLESVLNNRKKITSISLDELNNKYDLLSKRLDNVDITKLNNKVNSIEKKFDQIQLTLERQQNEINQKLQDILQADSGFKYFLKELGFDLIKIIIIGIAVILFLEFDFTDFIKNILKLK